MTRIMVLASLLLYSLTTVDGLPCKASHPLLLVYNRLPWFSSREWSSLMKNQSALVEHQVTTNEKDIYTPRTAMQNGDALSSHGDALKMAKTIREIQQRSELKQRQRPLLLERSFSYLEIPDVLQGRMAWFGIVEDPIDRAVKGFKGTPAELDDCVASRGARSCVPCDTMTAWFCGGGPMCSTNNRGLAALVRAKLVLARDYTFVGVRERWVDSVLILEKVLPSYFQNAGSNRLAEQNKTLSDANLKRRADFLDVDEPRAGAALRPETRRLIREANSLDVELYNHAVAQLDIMILACLGRPSYNAAGALKLSSPSSPQRQQGDDDDPDGDVEVPKTNDGVGGLEALGRHLVPSATNGLAGHCVIKRQGRGGGNGVAQEDRAAAANRRRLLSPVDHGIEDDDTKSGSAIGAAAAESGYSYCFPNAIGVGASRAGIGFITALLDEHPLIRVPEKSLGYFGRASRRGRRGVLSYVRNFPVSERERQVGTVAFEASADYALSTDALREARSLLGPSVKIVFSLREPTARAYDDFWRYARAGRLYQRDRELFICYEHAFGAGLEGNADDKRPAMARQQRTLQMCASRGQRVPPRAVSPLVFDAYARQVVLDAWEPERHSKNRRKDFNDSLPLNYEAGQLNENILSKSFYSPQLSRIFSLFPAPEQVHVVAYEDIFSPTRGPNTLKNLGTFLGIDKSSQGDLRRYFTAERIASVAASYHGGALAGIAEAAKPGAAKAHAPYPAILRKTRRLLEAFYTVDAEILRRMLPNLELPW